MKKNCHLSSVTANGVHKVRQLSSTKRFNYVEAKAKEKGQDLKDLTLEQMDAWWNEAKALG